MRIANFVTGTILTSAIVAQGAQNKPLDGKARATFLATVEARMAKVKSVVAAFEQEKHLSLFGDVVRTHGYILYSRPDLLRWEIRQPFRSILIVAKRDVAKFTFKNGRRRALELGRSADIILIVMDQIRSWFRGDFTRSTKNYQVSIFTPTKAPARIELRPKDQAMGKSLQAIVLSLSKNYDALTQVTIREAGGDRTIMRFRELGKNPPLAKAYFDSKNPRALSPEAFRPKTPKPTKTQKPKTRRPTASPPEKTPGSKSRTDR